MLARGPVRSRARSGRGALAAGGHGDDEARALGELAFHPHVGAHALGQVLDDGEAEPGPPELAAARLVHAVETLEDPGQVLRPDAGPVVAHLPNGAPGRPGAPRHLDPSPLP